MRLQRPALLLVAQLSVLLAIIIFTCVALSVPVIGIGLLYALLFWLLAWKRPGIALMLIFAAAPFQSDVSGGGFAKFSIAEINLVLTVPVLIAHCVVRKRLPYVGPTFIPVMLYFAVCIYSSMVNWYGDDALLSIVQMFLYFVVAVMAFASFTPKPESLMLSLKALLFLCVALALLGLATNYSALGLNKNAIGGWLGCGLLILTEFWLANRNPRHKNLLLGAFFIIATGLFVSLSRGAWLGTLAGLCVILALRRQFALLIRGGLILIPLVALLWNVLPQQSRDYTTGFSIENNYNIKMRFESLNYAQQHFERSPIYGMGVGLRKEYDATNIVMLTLAETGVLGLITFLAIQITFFRMIYVAQKYIPRTDVLYSFLTIGGALVANKLMHGMVDHYWTRGTIMATWAAAGMAARAYLIARHRQSVQQRTMPALKIAPRELEKV